MNVRRTATLIAVLLLSSSAFAQTQTTGRIAGTMRDPNGAVIVGAEVTVVSRATGDQRKASTDSEGNYAVPLLPPGTYRVKVAASGFHTEIFDVEVVITQTTPINVDLPLAGLIDSVVVHIAPLVQRDGPQLGRSVDARTVSELPLATRKPGPPLWDKEAIAVPVPPPNPLRESEEPSPARGGLRRPLLAPPSWRPVAWPRPRCPAP